ncbi:MAG: thiamine diphosphokinase [Peptostreptococcaceae bacterium]|nr:thiamine diphosphokinase [Peptostreptococcaceae bacterium]
MKCFIVGNGEIADSAWLSTKVKKYSPDLIIAADGGFNHLKNAMITPDVLLGDFDSIEKLPESKSFEILTFPKEKDFTDIELAVEYAIDRGCDSICLAGATGSRMDHSIANVFLLRKLYESGIESEIVDEHHKMFLINGHKTLYGFEGSLLSLLPLDPIVRGVTLKGFEYPLENASIRMGDTIGMSNIVISKNCEIFANEGLLLGIFADKSL